MTSEHVDIAKRLIDGFAARTGLHGSGDTTQRYLWTDAFAVFALASLYRRTGAPTYLDCMLRLVDLVHETLGRFRPGDVRTGWISGLSESEGRQHPTAGGLRIGKPLPERGLGEAYDDQLEWDRDGQYFHYLTKWMSALACVTAVTDDPRYLRWAVELAKVAHHRFVYQLRSSGTTRMYWKMSVDLSRPTVPSMGHHDPLDGYVTFAELAAESDPAHHPLVEETADLRQICGDTRTWVTPDPLGIGGLLTATSQLAHLVSTGDVEFDILLPLLLPDAQRSLETYVLGRELALPPSTRLPFRELGLSIGLHCLGPMRAAISLAPDRFAGARLLDHTDALARFAPLAGAIEHVWSTPGAQRNSSWTSHLDINAVMLAVSLVPDALTEYDSTPASRTTRTAWHR